MGPSSSILSSYASFLLHCCFIVAPVRPWRCLSVKAYYARAGNACFGETSWSHLRHAVFARIHYFHGFGYVTTSLHRFCCDRRWLVGPGRRMSSRQCSPNYSSVQSVQTFFALVHRYLTVFCCLALARVCNYSTTITNYDPFVSLQFASIQSTDCSWTLRCPSSQLFGRELSVSFVSNCYSHAHSSASFSIPNLDALLSASSRCWADSFGIEFPIR